MNIRCAKCMGVISNDNDVCPLCGHINVEEESPFLKPGTVIKDRYTVGEVLGYGGFGATYVGWDEKLDQKVAIKEYFPSEFSTRKLGQQTLSAFSGEKGDYYYAGLKKYLKEARTLAKLENIPNIVRVKEYFEENNTAYIVMEFVEGITLKEYINKNGTLSASETVQLFLPLIKSLEKVHAENVIHRDISPDNIMINESGIKLIDFGAAREVLADSEKSLSIVLKHGYAPKEQYSRNGNQGPWTDVYSLCATMYKVITGETPPQAFERVSDDELLPPSQMNITISNNIENAILKGLCTHPEHRFQTMRDLHKALSSSESTEVFLGWDAGFVPASSSTKKKGTIEENPFDRPLSSHRQNAIDEDIVDIPQDIVVEEKKSNSKWVIILLSVLFLIVAIVMCLWFFGDKNNSDQPTSSSTSAHTENNYEEIPAIDEEPSSENSTEEVPLSEEETTTTTTTTTTRETTSKKETTTTTTTTKKIEYFQKAKCGYGLKRNGRGEVVGMEIKVWGTYTKVDEEEVIVCISENIYYDEDDCENCETSYEYRFFLPSESSEVFVCTDDYEDLSWKEGTCSCTINDNFAVISLAFHEPVESGKIDFWVGEGVLINTSNGEINRAYDVYEIYF